MSAIQTFPADHAGALVFPADASNCYAPATHGGVPNAPRAFVLHTPEEPADGYPATPGWFAQAHPDRPGSTHYFVAYTGAVYQCVPESWGAIANGLYGKPVPAWANPATSLNWQTLSVEIEGYAATIQETLAVGGPQWRALVALVRDRCAAYRIPLDRGHLVGHYELSIDRSDPGAGFPWAAFIEALKGDDMKPFLVWDKDRQRVYLVGAWGAAWITQSADVAALAVQFGGMSVALSAATIDAIGAR